jgi:hypothetical protein
MGNFCAATGIPPREFWEMKHEEVEYIVRGLNKRNG